MKNNIKISRLPPMQALRAFDAVARLGSVGDAAEELHVTHGAISHQIHGLEALLGTPLIDRSGRRQTLTELGRVYAYQVRQALDALTEATADLSAKTMAGRLSVSVLPSFAQGWLVPRLKDWMIRYPDIRLHIESSMNLIDFKADDCDCAIRFGHGQWPDVEVRRIMGDELIIVCASSMFASDPCDPDIETILAAPRLQSSESWPLWLNAVGIGAPHHSGPSLTFTDSTHLLEAARCSLGVALTRASIADSLLRRGELRMLSSKRVEHPSSYYLVWPRRSRAEPYVHRLWQWLDEQSKQFQTASLPEGQVV